MPSHVGASRIDKAYVGTQEVSAMYLGTEKVYPNTPRWERWQPKWVYTAGESLNYAGTYLGYIRHFDGTTDTFRTQFQYMSIGTHFLGSAGVGSNVKTTALDAVTGTNFSVAKDALIDIVEDIDENAYPEDGVVGDYWYVKM